MVRKTLNYFIFISLLCALWLFFPLKGTAQNYNNQRDTRPVATKKEKKAAEIEYPLYNGVFVGIDLWGIGSGLLGGNMTSSEVVACVDLKHRFFPTVEVGYGKTDEWSDDGIHYKSGAPYFRIGMDYNALYKKKHGHMILVGLRYGFSSFNYDIGSYELNDPIYGGPPMNPNISDDIWGGSVLYQHPYPCLARPLYGMGDKVPLQAKRIQRPVWRPVVCARLWKIRQQCLGSTIHHYVQTTVLTD